MKKIVNTLVVALLLALMAAPAFAEVSAEELAVESEAFVKTTEKTTATMPEAIMAKVLVGYRKEYFGRVYEGEVKVSKPMKSLVLLPDKDGELRANVPTMLVGTARAAMTVVRQLRMNMSSTPETRIAARTRWNFTSSILPLMNFD